LLAVLAAPPTPTKALISLYAPWPLKHAKISVALALVLLHEANRKHESSKAASKAKAKATNKSINNEIQSHFAPQ